MAKTKSLKAALWLTLLFGPCGLFYISWKHGFTALSLVFLLIATPYALFSIALENGWKDVVVLSVIMIANTYTVLAFAWLITIAVGFFAVRRMSRS